jgi:hypothetical protein
LAALPPSRQLEAGADLPLPVALIGVTRRNVIGTIFGRYIAFGRFLVAVGGLAGRRAETAICLWLAAAGVYDRSPAGVKVERG